MPEMSPGLALREIQAAHARLKKARRGLLLARENPDRAELVQQALQQGWDGLLAAHKAMAAIPLSAANDAVLTKQLALQRYATALLVRLRRIVRRDADAFEGLDTDDDSAE